MSDTQLKKIEEECERLRQEMKLLSNAITSKEACKKIIEFVNKQPEAFCQGYPTPNPWHTSGTKGGGCNIL